MSYIGRQLNNLSDRVKLDSITTSATATYNLLLNTVAYVPSSAESLTVSLNGVIQAPQDSYTVSGSTITFASTLSASDSIDFILAERSITLQTPSAGSVGLTQLSATGTKDATTFLRGDNTFASAGLSGWSEDGVNNNLLPASASAGIYLGVNSATASNLLDDYEFGTFTPSIAPTSGAFSAVGTQSGFYTKIGNLVHYQCELSVITNGTGSGSIDVTGLPFTSASTGLVHTVNHGRETQIDGSTFVTIQSVNTTALVMLGPPFGNGAGYSLNGTYRV